MCVHVCVGVWGCLCVVRLYVCLCGGQRSNSGALLTFINCSLSCVFLHFNFMTVLSACMSVQEMSAWWLRRSERWWIPLGLELQMFGNHHVDSSGSALNH